MLFPTLHRAMAQNRELRETVHRLSRALAEKSARLDWCEKQLQELRNNGVRVVKTVS